MVKKQPKYWMGDVPTKCDLIGEVHGPHHENMDKFVDGKTQFGPWANMCIKCFNAHGSGLGLGHGQEYTKQPDGRYLKTGG